MAIGDRIKEARLAANLSQKTLSEMTGIQKSTISEYETGKMTPTANAIFQLLKALHVDANFLLQDEVPEIKSDSEGINGELTDEEFSIIELYRSLDRFGQDMVNMVLEKEIARCEAQKDLQRQYEIVNELKKALGADSAEKKEPENKSQTSKTG